MSDEKDEKLNYAQLNIEPEYSSNFTLKERAYMMVESEEYQNKIKLINEGHF